MKKGYSKINFKLLGIQIYESRKDEQDLNFKLRKLDVGLV